MLQKESMMAKFVMASAELRTTLMYTLNKFDRDSPPPGRRRYRCGLHGMQYGPGIVERIQILGKQKALLCSHLVL